MTHRWPLIPLGDVISSVDRAEDPEIGKAYRQIGVRLWGQGAYERESMDGGATKYKTLSWVETDDIIVNKIWARNGSVAVVPQTLAGCYCSSEFPTFSPIRDKLGPKRFHWITKTKWFWSECDVKSRGTSGKNRIRPEKFLEIEIPLPPPPEQRRIVARIEELATKIEEARGLRKLAMDEAETVSPALSSWVFQKAAEGFNIEELGGLIRMASGEGLTSSEMDDSFPYPVYGGGGLAGKYSRYLFEEPTIAIGRVGARCGCIFLTEPKSWITDNALYITEASDRLDRDYLVSALSNLDLRQQANQAAQPVVSQKKINPMKIPVPPKDEQRRIVAYLDEVQSKVDALKKLQEETAKELDALLLSVLDRAFKGEL